MSGRESVSLPGSHFVPVVVLYPFLPPVSSVHLVISVIDTTRVRALVSVYLSDDRDR